jgi:hypothetical protein
MSRKTVERWVKAFRRRREPDAFRTAAGPTLGLRTHPANSERYNSQLFELVRLA